MEKSAWELSKENIQPLKQGRQPAILSKALGISTNNVQIAAPGSDVQGNLDNSSSSSAIHSFILQQEKQEFENNLITCMNSEDPLGAYYRYIRWIEQTYPAGKEKEIRDLVNECLTSLKEQKWFDKYTDDIRYLYIWLKFATFSQNMGSITVYQFMQEHGHCVSLAGFYLQWAGELEASGHFEEAAKIFQTGIQKEARPLQSLVTAYEEFQARVARRLMEAQEKEDDDEESATRNVLGVLKAVPRRTTCVTTPYLRHSTMEEVKCGKAAPVAGNRRTEFVIYDENQENGASFKLQASGRSVGTTIPSEKDFCKENVQSADQWTKAKIQQASFVKKSATGQPKAFAIYVDESATPSASLVDSRQSLCASSSKSTSKASQPNFKNTTADGGKFMCRLDQIYDGSNEKSFEELRAARWQAKKIIGSTQKKVGPLAMATTPAPRLAPLATPLANRPALTPLAHSAASNGCARELDLLYSKTPASPPGNSSFTQNIYRDAMAAFSNTLYLSSSGPAVEAEAPSSNRSSQSSAVFPKRNSQAAGFAIFEDPAPGENGDSIPKQEADKENIDPIPRAGTCSSGVEKKRRNVAGILCPSTEFPCLSEQNNDDVFIVEEEEENRPAIAAPTHPAPLASTTYSMGNHTSFDFNESTVAGFHRFLPPNGNRAFSTPCHNASRMQPLSLSSCRPLDFADAEDTGHHPVMAPPAPEITVDVAGSQTVGADPGCLSIDGASKNVDYAKKLSTIAESSREYVSSSSGSNSTTSGGDTRRRLLSGASGIATMPSISETDTVRNKLAFGTPFSDGGFGIILTGASDDGAMRAHGTSYENGSVNKSGQKSTAVRRLLTDEDESQPNTASGAGGNMAINPWHQSFIDYQLSMIRPLENHRNYHTFDEKLPCMKAGHPVCLGGETYLILGVAGEGAYAQVYKCNLENEDSDFALKVQKPCCPIEFYICQELHYRLKVSNLLNTVERGLTIFRDAYMFSDGSVLVGDFTPYGTILDLVNIYKQSEEKSLPEVIVAYLTADILRIMEAVHSQKIIHGDVKPDNFLVLGAPQMGSDGNKTQVSTVRLIDWGRSIDMALIPPSVTFCGKSNTSGFICCEMQDGRPYTYQADYYGILGTVYVLAFGDYMTTHKIMATNQWRINKTFKRRWDTLWRDFFDTFLNVPDCSSLPSLTEWREKFDDFVRNRRVSQPSAWNADVKKMQDVLAELRRSIAKKKNLM